LTRPCAARFTLPLVCAPLANQLIRMHHHARTKLKQETMIRMLAQAHRRSKPLTGKPRVVVTRKSSKQPDADSGNGCKIVLDCLKLGGLGFIRDDDPSSIELEQHWVRVPANEGRLLVEVFPE
jgi:hypothetical protein